MPKSPPEAEGSLICECYRGPAGHRGGGGPSFPPGPVSDPLPARQGTASLRLRRPLTGSPRVYTRHLWERRPGLVRFELEAHQDSARASRRACRRGHLPACPWRSRRPHPPGSAGCGASAGGARGYPASGPRSDRALPIACRCSRVPTCETGRDLRAGRRALGARGAAPAPSAGALDRLRQPASESPDPGPDQTTCSGQALP